MPEQVQRVVTGDGYDPETKQQPSQWKSPNPPRLKNTRQMKSKFISMLMVFFDVIGNVHKELNLAGQTVSCSVTFYGHCLKMCEDFALNYGNRNTTSCITTTHRLTCGIPSQNMTGWERYIRTEGTTSSLMIAGRLEASF
jgi:hypothetical protein